MRRVAGNKQDMNAACRDKLAGYGRNTEILATLDARFNYHGA